MRKLNAAAYHEAVSILTQIVANVANRPQALQQAAMGESADSTLQMLERLSLILEPLSVPVTKLTLRDARRQITPNIQFFGCGQIVLNLSATLQRELETVKVFSIASEKAEFYESTQPLFGLRVQQQFPSLVDEVDQAGKCFACELPTASVFHSIRCLEAGIRAIARCLGIPDPTRGSDRNWSSVSRLVKAQIDSKWPAGASRMTGDGELFEEIHGALAAIQNPYRNATMHLDAKYSSSEALHNLEVVKGLMGRIALRMDEQGLPRA